MQHLSLVTEGFVSLNSFLLILDSLSDNFLLVRKRDNNQLHRIITVGVVCVMLCIVFF